MTKTYMIKECFYSPQGEGHRVGTMNVFLRFSGCNLQCTVEKEGFNCDTNFQGGDRMTLEEVVALVKKTDTGGCRNVILTGGEPTLQLDTDLCEALHLEGYNLHLETNGTREPPRRRNSPSQWAVDWISCSPKPGSLPVLRYVNELRCVVKTGLVPETFGILADHYFVSPACWAPSAAMVHSGEWRALPTDLDACNVHWALLWIEKNPQWRISLQLHKILGVR